MLVPNLFSDREILLALGLAVRMTTEQREVAVERLNEIMPRGQEFGRKELDAMLQKAEWFLEGITNGWIGTWGVEGFPVPEKEGTSNGGKAGPE